LNLRFQFLPHPGRKRGGKRIRFGTVQRCQGPLPEASVIARQGMKWLQDKARELTPVGFGDPDLFESLAAPFLTDHLRQQPPTHHQEGIVPFHLFLPHQSLQGGHEPCWDERAFPKKLQKSGHQPSPVMNGGIGPKDVKESELHVGASFASGPGDPVFPQERAEDGKEELGRRMGFVLPFEDQATHFPEPSLVSSERRGINLLEGGVDIENLCEDLFAGIEGDARPFQVFEKPAQPGRDLLVLEISQKVRPDQGKDRRQAG